MDITVKIFFVMLLIVACANQSSAQWNLVFQGDNGIVNCITANESTTIYAGCEKKGIFYSLNGGLDWSESNTGLTNQQVRSLTMAVYKVNPEVVGSVMLAGTWGDGVFQSFGPWDNPNIGLSNLYISALYGHWDFENYTVLAGTWGGGVFISNDAGVSWTAINTGITNLYIRSLLIDGSYFFAGSVNGLFRKSVDEDGWITVNSILTNKAITALAKNGEYLFAGTSNGGIFRSSDNGSEWSCVNTGLGHLNIAALEVSPVPGGTLIIAATWGGGVYYSADKGEHWTAANEGMTGNKVRSLFVFNNFLFAGNEDGSIWRRPLSDFAIPESTTWIVTNTNASGTGSLAWAIEQTNSHSGPDTIKFAIPFDDPGYEDLSGFWHINLKSELWISDNNLFIDGFSQAVWIGKDMNPYGPEIEIGGLRNYDGSIFSISGSGVEIACIGLIGMGEGCGIRFSNVDGGKVLGCCIGTPSHSDFEGAGNMFGIHITNGSRNIQIGAPSNPVLGNIISGNIDGIVVSLSSNISILGNRIGTNRTSTDILGNSGEGIYIDESDSTKIFDNIIGGNNTGIYLLGTSNSEIGGNYIGTDSSWSHNLRNLGYGIFIGDSSCGNSISVNSIVYNQKHGIIINDSMSCNNTITQNSISLNGLGGIRNQSGGNKQMSPPIILSATETQISGTTGPGYTVELYEDASFQGRYFKGTAVADGYGTFSITLHSPVNPDHVTATATDLEGNTSEFGVWTTTSVRSDDDNAIPQRFALFQNYPNPFNPTTTIEFQVPVAGNVQIVVYDFLGREVSVLLDERKNPGSYNVIWDGSHFSSGIYICRMMVTGQSVYRKMILMK